MESHQYEDSFKGLSHEDALWKLIKDVAKLKEDVEKKAK